MGNQKSTVRAMKSEETQSESPSRPSLSVAQQMRKENLQANFSEEHATGCLPWIQYKLHIPFQVHNIPHNEATVIWDSFRQVAHHREEDMKPSGSSVFAHDEDTPIVEKDLTKPILPLLFIRILALVGLFFITFGPSTGYASVGALSDYIKKEYDVGDSEVGLLFSIYSLLNIFSVFFAGLLVDKWGPNKSCVLFAAIIWIGNLLPLLKLFTPNSVHFPSLMLGRVIYGVGTECMGIVQSALLARWYSHDPSITLALSNSITLMSFRFSGLVALVVFPALAEINFDMTLGIIAIIANVSVTVGGILLVLLDYRYATYLKGSASVETVKLRDLLHLPLIYWSLVVGCAFFYGSVLSFIGFAPSFISRKWDMSNLQASTTTSSFYIAAGIGLPFFGVAIDKIAHRVTFMAFGTTLPVIGYAVLLFSAVNPLVGCILIGLSYCIVPIAMWPSVPLVVPAKVVGTAFGIMTCLCNFGMFIFPVICGAIKSGVSKNQFQNKNIGDNLEIFTLFISTIVTLLLVIIIWFIDVRTGATLETTKVLKLKPKKH